ncbi:MAG: FkbM family methyltransferase [Pirellulaceae bacterium]|nr:FkbM family methyltransferase [Pirellulaceae bacterium]
MLLKLLKQQLRQHRLRRAGVLDETGPAMEKVGDWVVAPNLVGPESVVHSFGVGDNVAWDLAMIARFGVTVHAFDPTPASMEWVARQKLPAQFRFHPLGISNRDGELLFYPPRRAGTTHYSQDRRGGSLPPVAGQVRRLATIARDLGHNHIDILKLDVEGSEFDAVPDLLASGIPVEQLLVEIHYHFPTRSFGQGLALIRQIKAQGYACRYVSPRGYEFAFVRK